MNPSAPRIVIVGNVTEDLTPECAWTPGGPALYSARAAAALGADVTLVSRVPEDYDRSLFEGLTVKELPAEGCPRFENTHPDGGLRRQMLHQAGEPIAADDVPTGLTADAAIAAPVLDELEAFPPVEAPVRIVSLQGALRWAMPNRPVRRAAYAPSRARALQPMGAIAVFSDEDRRRSARPRARALRPRPGDRHARGARRLALSQGCAQRPARLRHERVRHHGRGRRLRRGARGAAGRVGGLVRIVYIRKCDGVSGG